MLLSVEQAFVGRDKIWAPLKMPAWEASDHNEWSWEKHTLLVEPSCHLLHFGILKKRLCINCVISSLMSMYCMYCFSTPGLLDVRLA